MKCYSYNYERVWYCFLILSNIFVHKIYRTVSWKLSGVFSLISSSSTWPWSWSGVAWSQGWQYWLLPCHYYLPISVWPWAHSSSLLLRVPSGILLCVPHLSYLNAQTPFKSYFLRGPPTFQHSATSRNSSSFMGIWVFIILCPNL